MLTDNNSNEAAAAHRIGLSKSDTSLLWTPAGGTLLEFLESSGVEVESSCRMGSCGTCEARLLKGTYDYDPEPFIDTPGGAVFLCCARPNSDMLLEL